MQTLSFERNTSQRADVSNTAPDYHPPRFLKSGHAQTVYPILFRKPRSLPVERSRLELPDGDFLDLDWLTAGHGRLAFLCHGLEGNSRGLHTSNLMAHLFESGWDVAAMNHRGCSGEPNRLPRLYHSGETDDLHAALRAAIDRGGYPVAALVGYSMGGNQILKYLGEDPERVPSQVCAGATLSVPCDLESSAGALARPANRVYMRYFLRTLRRKIAQKKECFPDRFDTKGLASIRTFEEFDERFTAPLHGFAGARDYWRRASARPHLARIRVPCLLVNAVDDPFLAPECFPTREAARNPNLRLEIQRHGGHLGFVTLDGSGVYWSERRVGAFLEEVAG